MKIVSHKSSAITVMHYNQCYGLPARTLGQYLVTHIPHFLSGTETMRRFSNIEPTIKLVKNFNPDIVSLCEVLGETQRRAIESELISMGYQSVHVGQGHRFGARSHQHVEIMLATKLPSCAVDIPELNMPPAWGHGGGIIAADIVDLNTRVVAAHLAHPIKRSRQAAKQQLEVINRLINKADCNVPERLIVAMDANCTYSQLPSAWQDLEYYSHPTQPTYQVNLFGVPLVKWHLDHIIGSGFKVKQTEVMAGNSDHKVLVSRLG